MIVIMACAIGYNLKSSGYKNMASGLVSANVEALAADNEHSGGGMTVAILVLGLIAAFFILHIV